MMRLDRLLCEGGLERESCAPLRRYLNENAGNFIDFRTI